MCKGRLGRACEAGARGCLSIPLSVILESCYIHVVAPGFRSPTHRWIKLTSTEKGNQRACERVKRGQNSERGRRPGSTASPVFPSICVCCLAFYGNTLGALFDPRIGHLTSFDLSLGNTRARGAGDEDGRAKLHRYPARSLMGWWREGETARWGLGGVGSLGGYKEGSLVCPLTRLPRTWGPHRGEHSEHSCHLIHL